MSPETIKTVLSAEVPDGLDTELNTNKIPEPQGKLYYTEVPPYVEPTDKEMIEGLEMCGYYDEAYRIRHLKKEVMVLKGKLTKLQKKYDACEADRQAYMVELMRKSKQ